jgi:hypothetical protein
VTGSFMMDAEERWLGIVRSIPCLSAALISRRPG